MSSVRVAGTEGFLIAVGSTETLDTKEEPPAVRVAAGGATGLDAGGGAGSDRGGAAQIFLSLDHTYAWTICSVQLPCGCLLAAVVRLRGALFTTALLWLEFGGCHGWHSPVAAHCPPHIGLDRACWFTGAGEPFEDVIPFQDVAGVRRSYSWERPDSSTGCWELSFCSWQFPCWCNRATSVRVHAQDASEGMQIQIE
jgi:hypothetical protein